MTRTTITFTLLFFTLVPNIILAQGLVLDNLSIAYGNSYDLSDKGNSIPEGINTWQSDWDNVNIKLSLGYRKIKMFAYYTTYEASTTMAFREHRFTHSNIVGRIRTYNIGVGKDLVPNSRYISVEPFLSLGLQHSAILPNLAKEGIKYRGPLVYSVTPEFSETKNIVQLIPSGGLRLYTIIGKRILFGIDAQFTYAAKPYQKISFDYYTRNDPTIKTAEFVSTGTGFFVCPFLGYSFHKKSNKSPKTKYNLNLNQH